MTTTAKCPCCPPGEMNHASLPVLRRAQTAERKARATTERAEAAVDNWQVARRKIVHKRLVALALGLAALLLIGTGHWLIVVLAVLAAVWLRHSWQQARWGRDRRTRRKRKASARRNFGHAKPGSQADLARRVEMRTRAYELHEDALVALASAERNCPAEWRFPELDERTAARVNAAEAADDV